MPFRVLKHNLYLARYNMRRKETEYGHMFFLKEQEGPRPLLDIILKRKQKKVDTSLKREEKEREG
jgi:hypothetical protein